MQEWLKPGYKPSLTVISDLMLKVFITFALFKSLKTPGLRSKTHQNLHLVWRYKRLTSLAQSNWVGLAGYTNFLLIFCKEMKNLWGQGKKKTKKKDNKFDEQKRRLKSVETKMAPRQLSFTLQIAAVQGQLMFTKVTNKQIRKRKSWQQKRDEDENHFRKKEALSKSFFLGQRVNFELKFF